MLVVFSGEADAALRFERETGLDPTKTVMLLDPKDRSAPAFGVTVCPRIFVLNGAGAIQYTNNEPGSDPQTTPAAVLVSRTLTTLRRMLLPANQSPPPGKLEAGRARAITKSREKQKAYHEDAPAH